MTADLRDDIFQNLQGKEYIATLYFKTEGIVCGVEYACDTLLSLGCVILHSLHDGDIAKLSEPVLVFAGSAKAVAIAEDMIIGCIAKSTGIARAAARAVHLAAEHSGGKIRIVSGAAKKMPREITSQIRRAVHVGGGLQRIVDGPFLYLDKNYVRMFGSVAATLDGVSHMQGYTRVIQLRGYMVPLEDEARAALERDAEILMIDTGIPDDLDTVARIAREYGKRDRISIAFSGNVTHDHIADICTRDVDIIAMGAAIMDAPLADCTLDVAPRPSITATDNGLVLNLLQKTELRIDGISLDSANLTNIAAQVAECLGLPLDKVLVIDVRPGQLALDILLPTIRADQIFGKERQLLRMLAAIQGVTLDTDARVHSEGILGTICLDEEHVPEILARTQNMGTRLQIRKGRVRIFPTGFELIERHIEDTNTPFLVKFFSQAGFIAEAGESLPDNKDALATALVVASEECSLVITTGGVGAEDKDFSVEAIQSVDPLAATPYLVRFTKGEGRHVKDGIRIAIGEKNGCLLVALPGPHDEVRLVAPVLLRGVKDKHNVHVLAEELASCLRDKMRTTHMAHRHACPFERDGQSIINN